jgi:tetratricopeptide (TPR) repeat protein
MTEGGGCTVACAFLSYASESGSPRTVGRTRHPPPGGHRTAAAPGSPVGRNRGKRMGVPGEGAGGSMIERSGDEAVYDGDLLLAKQLYGAAIDAYLAGHAYDAAIGTCRKLLRLAPDAVRTHFTLAYLLVGKGEYEDAVAALEAYGDALCNAEANSYARSLLTLLSYVTDHPRVRSVIERILAEIGPLGEPEPALLPDSEPLAEAGSTEFERWERLLPIALRDQ